jgi:DNA-binding PadR family transcriptional regulator
LGLLASESLSGYDLTAKANIFWHTTHSRIYPLLAILEQDGYVTYELVKQSDKPDKKIYSLTQKGLDTVKSWLQAPTDKPVTKDEFFFKIYCMYVLDEKGIDELLTEREEMYNLKLRDYNESLLKLKAFCQGKLENKNSRLFGRYISLQKAIGDALWGIKWCRWVRELYKNKKSFNVFDFTPFYMDDNII